MIVSLTRLRLVGWTKLLRFSKLTQPALEQAIADPNCVAAATYMGPGFLTFWTATIWKDEASMRNYVQTGPHKATLPWFAKICSEGATAHYETDQAALPEKSEIIAKLTQSPKFFRVEKPTPAQRSKIIPISAPWRMIKFK